MSGDSRRTLRRAVFSLIIVAGAAGLILGTSPVPASAAPLTAIGAYTPPPATTFPADALGGERDALASDSLLMYDPVSGAEFRRTENGDGTGLLTDRKYPNDPPVQQAHGRPRVAPGAVTAAIGATDQGTATSPFMQRTMSLSYVGAGSSATGSILQLTSPSDITEYGNGYTTLAAPTDAPTGSGTYAVEASGSGASTPPMLTATPGESESADSVLLYTQNGSQPELAQQWTVVPSGVGDYMLVSRADGTCLGSANGNATEVMCNASNAGQQWEVAMLPRTFGSGDGLYNGTGWLGFEKTSSGDGWGHLILQPDDGSTPPTGSLFTWQWAHMSQTTAIPASVAFPIGSRDQDQDRPDVPFALATGDLDGRTGPEGAPRDEAVVVYGSNGHLVISVVDYAGGKNGLPMVTTDSTSISLLTGPSSGSKYVSITASTADIEGTGVDDILITYEDPSNGDVYVAAARYSYDATTGQGTISMIGSPQELDPSDITAALTKSNGDGTYDVYSTAAAVGDFSGSGSQQLAWAGASANNGENPRLVTASLAVQNGGLSVHVDTAGNVGGAPMAPSPGFNTFIRVASGEFQPAATGTGSRQIAVVWAVDAGTQVGQDWMNIFTVHQGTPDTRTALIDLNGGPQSLTWSSSAESLSMAVGGFTTNATNSKPNTNWGIAISEPGPDTTIPQHVSLIQPQNPGTPPTLTNVTAAPSTDARLSTAGYELTSWDRLGDSLLLGTPIVMTAQQYTNVNLVGGAPPSQSDWLPDASKGKPGFVNVSRNQDFYLALGSTKSGAYENKATQDVNQSFGLTGSADISETVKEGVPLIAKGTESLNISGALSASFKSLGSTIATHNSSYTASVTQQTVDDDVVDATVQNFAVYRYPVLSTNTWNQTSTSAGSTCSTSHPCYGYWDVVVPGTPAQYSGGGKALAYFQPPWQVGNALSYPQLDSREQVPLTDVGTYSYVGADGTSQTSAQALLNQEFGIGSTVTHEKLDTTAAASKGSTETSEQGWSANGDVKAGVSMKVDIPDVASDTTDVNLQAGFNTAAGIVGSQTGQLTNSHGGSFDLSIPAVPAEEGYSFGTTYYYDAAGTPTVEYGVDLTSDAAAKSFWKDAYDQESDPALNLPDATVLTYDPNGNDYMGTVEWNPTATRQLIRGFTARMPQSSDPTTSGAVYGRAPKPGDPVVFDVQVSNYSLKKMPSSIPVDFYAVPVKPDGKLMTSTTNPVIHIGTTTMNALGPQGQTTVSSPQWTAVGGGPNHNGPQDWRIFVILNQADQGYTPIPEIHGLAADSADPACPKSSVQNGAPLVDPMTGKTETLQCGQNDQGYGELSVIPAAPTSLQNTAANVRLVGGGIAVGSGAMRNLTAKSSIPTVPVHDTTMLQVSATADHASPDHQTVIVYDGLPKNGKTVAMTEMRGVAADGTSTASFMYTPQTPGIHNLYAVILGTAHSGPNRGIIIRVDATATGSGTGGSGSGHGHGTSGSGAHNGGGAQPPVAGQAAGTVNGASVNTGGSATAAGDALPWMLVGLGAFLALGAAAVVRRRRRDRHASGDKGE